MENNQNLAENQVQNQQVQGWADVQLSADMPLNALVQFLNVLNQRLVTLEDHVALTTPDGKQVTITEIYRQQAIIEQEQLNQTEENNESAE